MKYLLPILLFLLIAASASGVVVVIHKHQVVTSGDDTCNGLVFSLHFEADEDVETGDPAGCADNVFFTDTDGDLTGANVVTASDGYLNVVNGQDYDQFDVTNHTTEGSVLMKIWHITYVEDTRFMDIYEDATNFFIIRMPSASDVEVFHRGTNISVIAETTNNQMTTGSTYYVVGRWEEGASAIGVRVEIYDSGEVLLDSDNNTDDPSEWANEPGATDLHIGNISADAGAYRMHYVKIYDTYGGAPTSGFPAK